jgi:uncharacterized membrane-anchored protein
VKSSQKWILFGFMAIVQLLVPAYLIFESEYTMKEGRTLNFRTEPVDPNDVFRGKYVQLRFTESFVNTDRALSVDEGQTVYITFHQDEEGFAIPLDVLFDEPSSDVDYLAYENDYIRLADSIFYFQYPFDRFYMEESKAPEAELLYQDAVADTMQRAWATVTLHKGRAVLRDVMINGESISELAKKSLAK